jgi:hypothetical protein
MEMTQMRLNDKVAVVTGTASGIGKGIDASGKPAIGVAIDGAGKVVVIVTLLGLLGVSLWFAAHSFMLEGPPMPPEGYIAMAFGIVFSLVVGVGLMALLFYSSRRGFDEPAQLDEGERKGD